MNLGCTTTSQGQTQERRLVRLASIPIQRHVKVKGEANPYDPAWERYFETRLDVKMAHNLRGRSQLLSLWRKQKGCCPVCEQPITHVTGWHNHHIVWRIHGASDRSENRALLHLNCHRQVHSQWLDVVKSRRRR